MVSLWVIIGLVISAVSVSAIGAAFSVFGLIALFSGAAFAVGAMAIALESAKFVLAAYLHQRWSRVNFVMRAYLTGSVVILSLITSMGIFGFLSSAYQSSTQVLETENIKLEALKLQKNNIAAEIHRLSRSFEEIPVTLVTRRLKARAEIEPVILELTKKSHDFDQQITESNLKIHSVKEKVGPLIYISRSFNMDIDSVVKYLILILVLVFDPLAICLVIATSEALQSRKPEQQAAEAEAESLAQSGEVIEMRFAEEKDTAV